MLFTVQHSRPRTPPGRAAAYLVIDNWDDWFTYSTLYTLILIVDDTVHEIGGVKIGQLGMADGQRRPSLPSVFEALNGDFFSVGQDDSYYANLNQLGNETRDLVLRALNDLAADAELFERVLYEKVTRISLLRSVSPTTVRGQFRRMARGGARLSAFKFSYTQAVRGGQAASMPLLFEVTPESTPPTNVHILIGRNGVGKTHLLNEMTKSVLGKQDARDHTAEVLPESTDRTALLFSNLVSVTFSAFDDFKPLPDRRDAGDGVRYSYVGLKRTTNKGGVLGTPKSPRMLAREFVLSLAVCLQGAKRPRWLRAITSLQTDPVFKDAHVIGLADSSHTASDAVNEKDRAAILFNRLSSGHKIILLTVTKLVELVEERTLVLLDEPEAHLHPPLLSAFVRALSDLLVDRNAVALIATHSPVVLQEVPRSCVWKLRRQGSSVTCERPEFETFGENVDVLTREVFGLEVTHAGFHELLRRATREYGSYDLVFYSFGGQLGAEARALVRAMLANRSNEGEP